MFGKGTTLVTYIQDGTTVRNMCCEERKERNGMSDAQQPRSVLPRHKVD